MTHQRRQPRGTVNFAQIQRNRKIERITQAIDNLLVDSGIDPRDAAPFVEKFTRDQWASFAVLAASNPPSETTIEQIKAIYRDRAKPMTEDEIFERFG